MSTIDTHASTAPAASGAGLACIADWIGTTDHKRLGRLYLGAAASRSSASAVVVRAARRRAHLLPQGEWLDVGSLTQLFALERFGLTYLVLLPAMVGVAIAVVPLQVGARSLALPRLAVAGFWAVALRRRARRISPWSTTVAPAAATPASSTCSSLSMLLVLLGLLAGAGAVATTILTTRAPGMNMRRVPYFTWSVLVLVGGPGHRPAGAHRRSALPVRRPPLPVAQRDGGQPALQLTWAGFGFTQPLTLLFAIPVLGLLRRCRGHGQPAPVALRGPIFAGIGLAGVGVFASVTAGGRPRSRRPVPPGRSATSLKRPAAVRHRARPAAARAFSAVRLATQGLSSPSRRCRRRWCSACSRPRWCSVRPPPRWWPTSATPSWPAPRSRRAPGCCVVLAGVLAAMGAVTYWGPKWWGRTLPATPTLLLALLGGARSPPWPRCR